MQRAKVELSTFLEEFDNAVEFGGGALAKGEEAEEYFFYNHWYCK